MKASERRLCMALVAAVPALMALASWDPSGDRNALQGTIRFLGLPVLGIEFVVVVIALAAGFRPLALLRTSPSWVQGALAALIALAVGTAWLIADDTFYASLRTVMWLLHLMFGLAMVHILSLAPPEERESLWLHVTLGIGLYVSILALFVAAIPNRADFDWLYLGLGVIHVRQLGFYALAGSAAALGCAAVLRGRSYWLSVTVLILALGLGFWSGTRGAPVALLAAFAIGLALVPALRKGRTFAALGIGVAGGVLLSLAWLPPSPLYSILRMSDSTAVSDADQASSGRLTMWSGTLAAIAQRPIFGHGETAFAEAVPEAEGRYNHPHNIVLQLLFQWGAVGTLLVFALLGWVATRLWARRRAEGQAPAFLVASGMAVMGLFEGSLYHPYPLMMTALALAFLASAPSPVGPTSSSRSG